MVRCAKVPRCRTGDAACTVDLAPDLARVGRSLRQDASDMPSTRASRDTAIEGSEALVKGVWLNAGIAAAAFMLLQQPAHAVDSTETIGAEKCGRLAKAYELEFLARIPLLCRKAQRKFERSSNLGFRARSGPLSNHTGAAMGRGHQDWIEVTSCQLGIDGGQSDTLIFEQGETRYGTGQTGPTEDLSVVGEVSTGGSGGQFFLRNIKHHRCR